MKLYTNEWTNTGMPKQLTWIFTTKRKNDVLGNAVGDIFAVNHDATLGFRHHRESGVSTVDVLKSKLWFYDEDEFEYDEEGNIVERYISLEHETLAHIFMSKVNDLYNHGRCDCDEILDQMRQFSNDNNLGLIFKEEYCVEEYCNTWMCYTQEFAHKAHFDDECVFAFSIESAKECAKDGFVPKTLEFEEVIMLYPDGDYDKDMAIVCYKEGGEN